ncbi:glutathione S-transferase family protein [Kerstersia similis]|uniref:glutathione S-transferase family protein n=1 Tax=Kerstersia similis TaxID=206505 RepID=UPI0039EE22A7
MKLLGSLNNPFVRKVRIVLAEKKLNVQWDVEDAVPETVSLRTHNPLGKTPCLVMEDDASLYDSRVIVEYLDTLSPVGRLIPPSGRERAAAKGWEALADGLLDACRTIHEERSRPEAQRSSAIVAAQFDTVHAALAAMNQQLGEQLFCMGVNFSLADIAVGCALCHLDNEFPELDWRTEHANLVRLHEKLLTRPSFSDTQQ